MAVFTPVSDDICRVFLKQYDIGEFVSLAGIMQGVENSNFHLKTTTNRYVLTLFEKRVHQEDLPFFLDVMSGMAASGIPCPEPIMGTDGNILHQCAGRPAIIISFLSGADLKPTQITPEHCRSLGCTLAKMHKSGAALKNMARPNDLSISGWRALAGKTGNRLDEIKPGLAEATHKLLQELSQSWPDKLNSGVVHADLFPDNVFFDSNGKVSGVIDFYFSCTDSFLYDYAIVQNAWCFDTSHNMVEERRMALLYGYMSEGGMVGDDEWKLLPLVAKGAALRFFLTRAHDIIFGDPNAFVKPKDPLEYWQKFEFYR